MIIRNGGDGRDERFQSYYQRYYRRVVRFYVRAFRFDERDAEELAQDAFLRFYEAMDEYRGDAEWAFFETVARNLALNKIRAGKTLKRNVKPLDLDDPVVGSRAFTPPPQIDAVRKKQMYAAVGELSAGQRACLRPWLRGFSYDEIARAMRISQDAVKSRIRDAKRSLRARLGDDSSLPEDDE